MEVILPLVKEFGLPTALVLLFVYLDLRRRKKEDKERDQTVERLVKLEDYQRDKLEGMVVENTTALQNNSEASEQLKTVAGEASIVNRQLITALRTRPCLTPSIDAIERDGV